MTGSERVNILPRIMLCIVIALLAAYVMLNYNALLNADSYAYLIYARDLARGSVFGEVGFYEIFKDLWPTSRSVDLHSGLRHLIDGRVYYGIEMGYPLFLAGAMTIAGAGAVYFVNPLLFLWLSIIFFLAVRLIFSRSRDREIVALISMLLMLLIPPDRILSSATKIMRDIPPLTFIMTSFYCLLLGRRPERYSRTWVFIGAFFLGLATLIRFHYLVMALPFFLYLIASLRAGPKKGIKWGMSYILFAFIGLAIFAVPVVIRDLLVRGDVFFTARVVLNHLTVVSAPTKLFSLEYFSSSGLWYLDFLNRSYGPVLLLLFLVGIAAGLKNRPIRFLLLPAALFHFLIFAFFRYNHSRYLLPIYPVISCLIGYGIMVSLNWILLIISRSTPSNVRKWLCRIAGMVILIGMIVTIVLEQESILSARNAVMLIFSLALLLGAPRRTSWMNSRILLAGLSICLMFLVAIQVVPSIVHPYSFKLSDVRRLKTEIEKYAPPGSLILATRYLKQNIDYYTDCNSMNIHQPGLPWGLSTEEALRKVMDFGIEVFVLDNKGKRKASKFLPILREHFDVVPVARWQSKDLGIQIRYVSENKYLNLYRVLPWKGKEVEFTLSPASKKDQLLIIDTGESGETPNREWMRLWVEDKRLEGDLMGGVNYVFLDRKDVASSPVVIKLESDLPLPAEIPVRYLGNIVRGFRIDVGESAKIKDWYFLDEGFFNDLSHKRNRTIFDRGAIRVPSFSVPGKTTKARLRVRNKLGKLSPLIMSLSLDGEIIQEKVLPPSLEWQEFDFSLPVSPVQVGTSFLEISARAEKPTWQTEECAGRKGRLAVDWVKVNWVSEPPGGS